MTRPNFTPREELIIYSIRSGAGSFGDDITDELRNALPSGLAIGLGLWTHEPVLIVIGAVIYFMVNIIGAARMQHYRGSYISVIEKFEEAVAEGSPSDPAPSEHPGAEPPTPGT